VAARHPPYKPVPPAIISGSFRVRSRKPSSVPVPVGGVTTSTPPQTALVPAGQDAWTVERSAVTAYLAVCERAANCDGFGDFKRAPAYSRILEHVTESQGRAYLDAVLAENPNWERHFPWFAENDSLGNPQVFSYGRWMFSPTTLRYVWVMVDVLRNFGSLDGLDIIEIGGGYGGQCKIIADAARFRSYTLVDLPAAARLQEKYLGALGVGGVRCLTPDALADRDYDLAISNFAMSELSAVGQEFYLERVLRRSQRGYLAWNASAVPDLSRLPGPVRVADEQPKTGPGNRIITWGENARNQPGARLAKAMDSPKAVSDLEQPSPNSANEDLVAAGT
jgi:hypothetical protein